MDGSTPYVLGVDGLPLGTAAVAAADGRVVATFELGPATGRAGVRHVVEAAVERATAELGQPPVEVRLVCVDDGGDGGDASLVMAWLAERSIGFHLLDLVTPEPEPGPGVGGLDRSADRARDAALW